MTESADEPDLLVLDATVLVYAVGSEHPYQASCRALVAAIESGDVRSTTTPEVIQEFVHLRARRRGRADAVELGLAFADLLSPLIGVDEEALRAGLGLFGRAERIGAFDAVLVAAARDSGVAALVSADRGFGSVPGLRHVIPDADGVASLIEPAVE